MAFTRRTKFAVVAAFLAGTAFLTGCQADDDKNADAAAGSRATPAPGTTAPAAPDRPAVGGTSAATERPAPGNSGASGKGGSASTGGASAPAAGEATRSVVGDVDSGKGVNGTWFGTVKYLAPGKYTVSDMKGVEQQFFLAQDTKIWGTGDICGDAAGQAATACTEEQLEAATKGAGVSAEVVVVNGTATVITDDH